MENYSKGKNVEEEWEKDRIPIPNLPENFTWMHVKGGSKMFNLLEFALNAFKETGVILWSGSGAAVGKAVSCAEIMKKRHRGLHQINKICYRTVEEFWDPLNADLDQLVVKREVPAIHILLSKDPLDENELGYQAPSAKNPFWTSTADYNRKRESYQQNRKQNRVSPKQLKELGLRSNANRQNRSSKEQQESRNAKKKQKEMTEEAS